MKKSISAPNLKQFHKPTSMRNSISNSSLVSDTFQVMSMSGTQIDDVACVLNALTVRGDNQEFANFPQDVLNNIEDCMVKPPEPDCVVNIEKKNIPMRHLEIMMKRRRKTNIPK